MFKSIYIVIILFIHNLAYCQASYGDEKDLQSQLPSLDTLIALAVSNSSALKFQDALVKKGKSQVEFAKSLWQNNIMGNVNISTGNQNLLTLNSTELQTTSISNGYRAGININIPLYEFSGRKKRINLHLNELEAAIHKRDDSYMLLERQVEEEYYKLISSYRILNIRSDSRESSDLHVLMVEKQFQQGNVPISELSRVKEISAKSSAEYELAYADYMVNLHQFEDLIGLTLDEILSLR